MRAADIVAIVPARSGSKTIEGKNITPLGNHPLIAYSIVTGIQSSLIDDVIVSTDSKEYAEISRNYGADVPFLRPKKISRDDSTDLEFVQHYLRVLDENGISHPRLIVHLRPTTPLRETFVVDAAIQYMLNTPEASSLRSMQPTNTTPYKLFRLDGEYARPFMDYPGVPEFYNKPRQFFEPTYDPNGYVDILRPAVIIHEGQLHGNHMKLWVTDPVADIDTLADYEEAKLLLNDSRYSKLILGLNAYHPRHH